MHVQDKEQISEYRVYRRDSYRVLYVIKICSPTTKTAFWFYITHWKSRVRIKLLYIYVYTRTYHRSALVYIIITIYIYIRISEEGKKKSFIDRTNRARVRERRNYKAFLPVRLSFSLWSTFCRRLGKRVRTVVGSVQWKYLRAYTVVVFSVLLFNLVAEKLDRTRVPPAKNTLYKQHKTNITIKNLFLFFSSYK